MERKRKEIKITPIKNGTAIDHIRAGQAPIVLKILGIGAGTNMAISLVMNVQSQKFGKKDIVMIENRELNSEETNKVALIAPNATINIIRDCQVVKKEKVRLPKIIEAILKCPNPNCVSNDEKEPIKSKFILEEENLPSLKCYYCGIEIENVPEAIKY